jgi:hypothetical protein
VLPGARDVEQFAAIEADDRVDLRLGGVVDDA